MRRGIAASLGTTLVLAAVPALADTQVTGYFRTTGAVELVKAIGQAELALTVNVPY